MEHSVLRQSVSDRIADNCRFVAAGTDTFDRDTDLSARSMLDLQIHAIRSSRQSYSP